MASMLMGTAMAKKRAETKAGEAGEPQKRVRKTSPVQVESSLARMIAVVATHDGITQADLLNDHLRPFVITHYKRVQKAIAEEIADMNDQQ